MAPNYLSPQRSNGTHFSGGMFCETVPDVELQFYILEFFPTTVFDHPDHHDTSAPWCQVGTMAMVRAELGDAAAAALAAAMAQREEPDLPPKKRTGLSCF
jgi:hypothetical protein